MDLSWVRRDDMTNLSEIKSASSSRFVMVLRDPYNWAASGYRKGHPISELRVGLWMKYARQATGEVDYFGIGDDARVVLYNHWFSDVDYRKEIAEWLDLPFTDEGLLVVPPFGLGSSFDLRSYNGRAQEMQVLDRWKVYADEPWFVQLFEEHPELEHYSKRLFGVSYL